MKKLYLLLILSALSGYGRAQSLNIGWQFFQSKEYGFSLEHPQNWRVSKLPHHSFLFFDENKPLGTFSLSIAEGFSDSAAVYRELQDQYGRIDGGKMDESKGGWILSYKTAIINDGKSQEAYHWTFGIGSKVYAVQYIIDSALKTSTDGLDEVKIVFRMLETLTFGL